jgi:hypothetical protein
MEILWRCEDFEQQKSRAQGPAKKKGGETNSMSRIVTIIIALFAQRGRDKSYTFFCNLKPIRRDADILP